MTHRFRRTFTIAAAAALLLGMAAEPVLAQVTPGSASVGPAGGVGSTTAPSNSAGTPAGGTGVISTTRVGPSGVTAAPTQNTTPVPTAASQTPTPRRTAAQRRAAQRRPATQVGTQSQAGTNGASATTR